MRPIWARTAGDESGLTLAEMLLVLAITALVAGLVVGRGLPGQGAVRSASLQAWLQGVRSDAMVDGRSRLVSVTAGADGLAGGGAEFVLGAGFLVSLSPVGGIRFQPDGSTGGGEVVVLAPGGGSYGVGVAAVTGVVSALP